MKFSLFFTVGAKAVSKNDLMEKWKETKKIDER
jgi:hypothetical protein